MKPKYLFRWCPALVVLLLAPGAALAGDNDPAPDEDPVVCPEGYAEIEGVGGCKMLDGTEDCPPGFDDGGIGGLCFCSSGHTTNAGECLGDPGDGHDGWGDEGYDECPVGYIWVPIVGCTPVDPDDEELPWAPFGFPAKIVIVEPTGVVIHDDVNEITSFVEADWDFGACSAGYLEVDNECELACTPVKAVPCPTGDNGGVTWVLPLRTH